ncbi:MAG: tol-pal system protein YbgF [Pseudomonadota bacterium]
MFRSLVLCLALAVPTGGAFAQDQTLADIRAELTQLYADVNALRDELIQTGQAGQGAAGATPLDRLNTIEAELTRLTSLTEELENRISRITRDGTNRIGDLEFRLCDLEEGCDIAALGETPSLGGVDAEPARPAVTTPVTTGPSLAIGEQADFEAAQEALAAEDFRRAADLLETFNETYPGSPVAADAHLLRAQAFEGLGEVTNAARSYLAAFSGAPEGPKAAFALTKLGETLGALGQVTDACVTLGEVAVRFPGAPEVSQAQTAMANLGCG